MQKRASVSRRNPSVIIALLFAYLRARLPAVQAGRDHREEAGDANDGANQLMGFNMEERITRKWLVSCGDDSRAIV